MDQKFVLYIFEFVVLIFAFSVHEAAHAWMAARLGDPTAMMLGRVTLNPLKHIDLFGSILLPIVGIIQGGWMIGWAKPCPITPRNFRNYKRDDILVSMAGPAVNLLVAILAVIILIITKHVSAQGNLAVNLVAHQILQSPDGQSLAFPLVLLLYVMVLVNLSLFTFNLIPVPPLDGSHVLRHFLPYNAVQVFDRIGMYGLIVVFFVLPFLTGINIFGMLFYPLLHTFRQVILTA
ncbi:MAG: site-2 protease family protein [Acidobacteriaceae bacterium]|nr:site-2 protease family protein [Acidobacteriaceae bacterium]